MKRIKGLVVWAATLVTMPCLVYYTTKFYVERNLVFEENRLLGWSIIVGFIAVGLIISLVNEYRLKKILAQNQKLQELVIDLSSKVSQQHYDSLHFMKNTREILLDEFAEDGKEDEGGKER